MLDETQKTRLMELFAAGCELPEDRRAGFVDQECADDPVLRHRLAELLSVPDAQLDGFLSEPILSVRPDPRALLESAPPPGEPRREDPPRIEGYEDFVRLAAGGMGTVYRALQVRPVRRPVAIKVIRPGMDSRSVLARFDIERQTLARMSHPYIAAVYDAGHDAAGAPYIAMEFVEGEPITEACRSAGLGLEERLALFTKLCDAVDHAHRRGVLHRDLKPSNVLVLRSGDAWIPKVIDFGIAKALEGSAEELRLTTVHGMFLGTPEYMSPEQLDGAGADIDTRADVYSLGVLLYELICGRLPFDATALRGQGIVRMTSILREESPPKPSTRARDSSPVGSGPCEQVAWVSRLPGDLDWIAMKALEKERGHRYGSARELAADIANHLEHRPVLAGPPTGLYRLRKFARRYRVQVSAAALVLLSLVLGLSGTIHFLIESRSNEANADARAREAIAAQREAEGIRIATLAAMLATESPNVALLLAIEASGLTDDAAVHRTIHRILPLHQLRSSALGNDHDVRGLHFLADGRLVVRPFDASALVVDADSGGVLRRLSGHTDVITDSDLHADGALLLTGSQDGTARIWDLESGACRLVTAPHEAPLTRAMWIADGERFATADDAGLVRLHATGSGTIVGTLGIGGTGPVLWRLDPSRSRLATATGEGPIRIFDLATGTLALELPRVEERGERRALVLDLHWSAAGDRLVATADGPRGFRELWIYTSAGERLPRQIGWSCVGDLGADEMLVCRRDAWGRLDARSGELVEHREVPGLLGLLGVAPDRTWVIGLDRQLDLCTVQLSRPGADPRGGLRKLLGESDKRGSFLGVAFDPGRSRFAVSGRRARVWSEIPEFAAVDIPGAPEVLEVVSLAAGARTLVLLRRRAAERPTWELWDGQGPSLVGVFQPEGIQELRLSSCGTRMIGTGPSDPGRVKLQSPRLLILDVEGAVLHDRNLPAAAHHQVRPDGRAVLLSDPIDAAGPLSCLLDLDSGERYACHPARKAFLHWSGGPALDRLAYLFGGRSRTDLIDTDDGSLIASVSGPEGKGHYAAAASADGRFLLTVLGDRTARVHDLTRRRPDGSPALCADYQDLVRSNSYVGGFFDGGRLAWAQCSNEVHVFESATGKPWTVLPLDAECAAVVERPDRREFLTLTNAGRLQRWPLDTVATARRLAVGSLTARQLYQYRVATPEQRRSREIEALRAEPSVRNLARLAELALEQDDLDTAIERYRSATDLGPLAPTDRRHYVRTLELLCRRLGRGDRDPAHRTADLDAALAALRESLRCGVSGDELLALPGIATLSADPRFPAALRR
jgi:serine/threonine protein kinase/WD40 repeat protein